MSTSACCQCSTRLLVPKWRSSNIRQLWCAHKEMLRRCLTAIDRQCLLAAQNALVLPLLLPMLLLPLLLLLQPHLRSLLLIVRLTQQSSYIIINSTIAI